MYLVFCGEKFYPNGGAFDVAFVEMDESEANKKAEGVIGKYIADYKDSDIGFIDRTPIEWSHVFCTEKKEVLYRFGVNPYSANKMIVAIDDGNLTKTNKGRE